MNWQHVYSNRLAWETVAAGLQRRTVLERPVRITEWQLEAGASIEFSGLGLIVEGKTLLSGSPATAGALIGTPQAQTISAHDGALHAYQLALNDALMPADTSPFVINASDRPWQDFEDPAGRPTQPVQVLLDGNLSALRTRFVPTYEAGEHWHDFDTLYFITQGDMQFGNEGQYHTGDIRHVRGGFSYGPEKPGPDGVEFVLLSLGGPVALHWADLTPAPKGALP